MLKWIRESWESWEPKDTWREAVRLTIIGTAVILVIIALTICKRTPVGDPGVHLSMRVLTRSASFAVSFHAVL